MSDAHSVEGIGGLRGSPTAGQPMVALEKKPPVDHERGAHKKSPGVGHPAIYLGALSAKGAIIIAELRRVNEE